MSRSSDQQTTELVAEIFRVNAALIRAGDELTADVSLSASRWQVLGALQDGPVSIAALGRLRGLRRQSARESVQRLERDGLVTRRPDPDDRRSPLLELTERGRDALDLIEPRRAAWAARLAATLDSDAVQHSTDLLRHLRLHLGQDTDTDD